MDNAVVVAEWRCSNGSCGRGLFWLGARQAAAIRMWAANDRSVPKRTVGCLGLYSGLLYAGVGFCRFLSAAVDAVCDLPGGAGLVELLGD
jgi:hypothetical protein